MDHGSVATIAEKILARRAELGAGQWLSEELRIALKELSVLMRRAELDFEEIRGGKSSIVIRSTHQRRGSAEGYSLRMMANSLENSANNMMSRTLEPKCLAARKELIETLRRLYVIMLKPGMLEEAKRWERHSARPERESPQPSPQETDADDPQERLLTSVLTMGAVAKLYREDPAAFDRLFDPIWDQVRRGNLSEKAAPGKLLDRVRARNQDTPGAEQGSQAPEKPKGATPVTRFGAEPQQAKHEKERSPGEVFGSRPTSEQAPPESRAARGQDQVAVGDEGAPERHSPPVEQVPTGPSLRALLNSLVPKSGKAVYRRILADHRREREISERDAAGMVLKLISGARLPRECGDPASVRERFQAEALMRQMRDYLETEPGLSPLAALDRVLKGSQTAVEEEPCAGFLLQVAREALVHLQNHRWLPARVAEQRQRLSHAETARVLYAEIVPLLPGKSEAEMLAVLLARLNGRELDGTPWKSPWDNAVPEGFAQFESWLNAEGGKLSRGAREILAFVVGFMKTASPKDDVPANGLGALDDWVVRGRAGNRLYKTLRRDQELATWIAEWQSAAGKPGLSMEQRFAHAFFSPITKVHIVDEAVEITLPRFGAMDLDGLKQLLEQGQSAGAFGVDPRIWKVIAVAFDFLDKECGLSQPA